MPDFKGLKEALERSDQFSASYMSKRVVEGLGYIESDVVTIPADGKHWYHVRNPSSHDNRIMQSHPSVESDTTITLNGYMNASIDTGTFTQKDPDNLKSSGGQTFKGNAYLGDSSTSTVTDFGTDFYNGLVGTAKKAGNAVSFDLIVAIEPGDSLLMELHNTNSGEAQVGFQVPMVQHEDERGLTENA